MKKLVKKTFKIFTWIFLIIAILIITGVVVGKVFSKEIRNYVISEINQEIEVKVNVSSAEFSVLRKFPYISIVLTDASVLSGKDFKKSQFPGISADTLFTASRIYLQFNIYDFLTKDYRLRRVHAVNGKLNVFVDGYGRENYKIFKTKKDNPKSNISFALDGVKLTNFSWQFLNLSKDIKSNGLIKELALKGKFSDNSFSLNTLFSLDINSFSREGINYANNLHLNSRLILSVHDSLYSINRGDLSVNDLDFAIKGSFITGSKTLLDLQIAGANLNISSLISALPFNKKTLSRYSPSGKAELLTKVKGEISSTVAPSIRSAFKIINGSVSSPSFGSTLNGINIKGTYSNGTLHNAETSRLNLSEYEVNYKNNRLTGKFSINNFIKPFLTASFSGTVFANDLSDFLKIEGLKLEKGQINSDLFLNISLDSFDSFEIKNIPAKSLNGTLALKDISGKTPYSDLPLELLDGTIKLEGETWFPELKIKLGDNRATVKLVVDNLWDYLVFGSKIPDIRGEVFSEYFRITDFIENSDSQEETDFHLPDSINLNLHAVIDSFVYGKFLAADAEAWFDYKPGLLNVSSLKMNTMRGNFTARGAVIADNQGMMLLRASGDLHTIDIHKLFFAFNNFGQTFIIADNLKGSASGSIDFSVNISPKLEMITKNLTAQSDFVIEEGELINFEPINELSSFVELSELQHIKFSTLKNSVLINNEKVFIPQMDINSSAFNITLSGTHSFENYFEYKLRLSLSEILARKAKKAKKENEEFGVIEDDGAGRTNLYLSITGTPDDFKIKYDRKEAINKIKADLKEEKKLLKTILKEELGLFKKDTISSIVNPDNSQKQFKMDWEEENKIPAKQEIDPKTKKAKKKDPAFDITWDEEEPGK